MDEENEEIPEEDLEIKPIEVKIVNPDKPQERDKRYDSKDDPEYDDLGITQEQLKEFEDGNT